MVLEIYILFMTYDMTYDSDVLLRSIILSLSFQVGYGWGLTPDNYLDTEEA